MIEESENNKMSVQLLQDLQTKINYNFKQKKLLIQALTHSSYTNEHHQDKHSCNERLEFLGDAVLELSSSDFLFHHYDQMQEGALSKKRAGLVCEPTLAYCARQIGLGHYLRLGRGEDATGGRDRDSILADAMEAVIGAIYLDGGIELAKHFVLSFILNDIEHKELFRDSKTALQEFVQSRTKETVTYELVEMTGPEHNRCFVVQAMLGTTALGIGSGRTKQAAGQEAAYNTLIQLKAKDTID